MLASPFARTIPWAVAILAAMSMAGCAPADAPRTSAGGIVVDGVWARPAGVGSATAIYFTLENGGPADDRLLGADVQGASASIHRTTHEDGVARMREVTDGLIIGAGQRVDFEPLGLHVMVADLDAALEAGETLDFTLRFESAGVMTVSARIAEVQPD